MVNKLAIDTLKISGVAAVNEANSGHPGIVLGAAPIMHTLFTKHINFSVENPNWVNRDRFIMSAGHGSALLYAQLRLMGLIETEDLKNFRKFGSITPGHPELGMTPGVEATTGPLGQGIAMGVGVALAEVHLNSKFPEIDHFTYVLCGDGDLQEGVAYEAMSFAGKQNLSRLIVLYDSNDIQLDTSTDKVWAGNVKERVEANNWTYILVEDGESVVDIDAAINEAKKSDKPTLIEIKTVIGRGATKEGTSGVHGAPLGDDIKMVRESLGWTADDFAIPQEVSDIYKNIVIERGIQEFRKWKPSPELEEFLAFEGHNIELSIDGNKATRDSSGAVIKYLNENVEQWIGGSADLSSSTRAAGGDGAFSKENRRGRNILFGVREFAMAAIGNGIALHSNLRPFVSTFHVFSDYLKPAMRLSSLMKLPVTYVLTHDSVFVGEDGPTHQPIEQNAMIRSIPGMEFFRPGDAKEVVGAYNFALNNKKPVAIALTRQGLNDQIETDGDKVQSGPYNLVDNGSEWTIVASGSEIDSAIQAAKELGLNAVSISNSKGEVNWDTQKAISIEAGTTFGMKQFAKYNFGIDTFGESGEGSKVYEHFKLDYNSVVSRIKEIINN